MYRTPSWFKTTKLDPFNKSTSVWFIVYYLKNNLILYIMWVGYRIFYSIISEKNIEKVQNTKCKSLEIQIVSVKLGTPSASISLLQFPEARKHPAKTKDFCPERV